MLTKQQFYNKRNIANLPAKEKAKRWQQHKQSLKLQPKRGPNRQRATGLVIKQKQTGDVLKQTFSPCALDYLLALEAPFSLKRPACVPDLHSIPSKKIRVKTKGTFSTGTLGVGWITCCNWCNANDNPVIRATAQAYTGAEVINFADPGVTGTSQLKVPYSSAEFAITVGVGSGIQARTVGVGLRMRYIGPELSRSGQITAFRHPDNETLETLTFAQIRSHETAKTYPVSKKWLYLMYRPVKPEDYHFSKNPDKTDNADTFSYEMAFIITDTSTATGVPGPAKFEWQQVRFVEYVGNIDNISRSHTDLVGMSHIRNQMPERSTTSNPIHHVLTIAKKIEDHIGEALPAAGAGALAYKSLASGEVEEEAAGGAFDSIISAAQSGLAELAPALETAAEFVPFLIP